MLVGYLYFGKYCSWICRKYSLSLYTISLKTHGSRTWNIGLIIVYRLPKMVWRNNQNSQLSGPNLVLFCHGLPPSPKLRSLYRKMRKYSKKDLMVYGSSITSSQQSTKSQYYIYTIFCECLHNLFRTI